MSSTALFYARVSSNTPTTINLIDGGVSKSDLPDTQALAHVNETKTQVDMLELRAISVNNEVVANGSE